MMHMRSPHCCRNLADTDWLTVTPTYTGCAEAFFLLVKWMHWMKKINIMVNSALDLNHNKSELFFLR